MTGGYGTGSQRPTVDPISMSVVTVSRTTASDSPGGSGDLVNGVVSIGEHSGGLPAKAIELVEGHHPQVLPGLTARCVGEGEERV